jgi:hypothetical protein
VSVQCFHHLLPLNDVSFLSIILYLNSLPLIGLPNWIVQLLQCKLALDRIAVYLDEGEVSEQVSSLKKKDFSGPRFPSEDEALGLENATFKCNEVDEKGMEKGKGKDVTSTATTTTAGLPIPCRGRYRCKGATFRGVRNGNNYVNSFCRVLASGS